MKHISRLTFLAAATAVFGASAAFADDPQLRTRLDVQRPDSERVQVTTTIAVYADRRGVIQRTVTQEERNEARLELRSNPHGQFVGAFVTAQ